MHHLSSEINKHCPRKNINTPDHLLEYLNFFEANNKHRRTPDDSGCIFNQKKWPLEGPFFIATYNTQNNLRPLLAAMRMRNAFSLMKPAASAWL